MAKGFGADPLTDSQQPRNEIAASPHHIRITFAEPSQDLATEPTYTGVELANLLGWSESTLRNRFKTVQILVTHGALTSEELTQNGRYTTRARHLLESLGESLAADRMSGPRWVEQQAETLKTFVAMAQAVPVEVVNDATGYSGAIELYQQRTQAIALSADEAIEEALTFAQDLGQQRVNFRQQHMNAVAQQATQDAVTAFKVYQATYAKVSNELAIASGNASVA